MKENEEKDDDQNDDSTLLTVPLAVAGQRALPEAAPVQARQLAAEGFGGDDPTSPGHQTPFLESPRPAAQTHRPRRGGHARQEQGGGAGEWLTISLSSV